VSGFTVGVGQSVGLDKGVSTCAYHDGSARRILYCPEILSLVDPSLTLNTDPFMSPSLCLFRLHVVGLRQYTIFSGRLLSLRNISTYFPLFDRCPSEVVVTGHSGSDRQLTWRYACVAEK
jgi:hypothetical protein